MSHSHQFYNLPPELWYAISSYLPNRDIKSLRLVSKRFCNSVELRLGRVFLSANPLNIKVFRAIADHEEFRHKISEIVWDDARFARGPSTEIIHPEQGLYLPITDASDEETEFESRQHHDEIQGPPNWEVYESDFDFGDREDTEFGDPIYQLRNSANFRGRNCPLWFKAACVNNIEHIFMRRRKLNMIEAWHQKFKDERKLGKAALSMNESWKIYQSLLRKQADVLAGNYDEEAFLYGLERFTALKRVTITPAAHGVPFAPLYQSPMIRAFPPGFNYPIPRGWPISTTEEPEDVITFPWQQVDERHREKYHAFRIVTRTLAQQKHNVVELILEARQLYTGINCTIFDQPCMEHDNLLTILKKPGFRRLDISLIFGGRGSATENWKTFRNGRLHKTLGTMTDLEEFTFYTAGLDNCYEWKNPPVDTNPVSLEHIFPVEKWSKLRHFALSRFIVSQADLITLLSKLPDTLRSVRLSFLVFFENATSWHTFLEELRTKIQERSLWPGHRPNVIIGNERTFLLLGGAVWLGKAVDDFLYEGGENPFYDPPSCFSQKGTWNNQGCI
ncbi:hypothetical protein N7533_001962 [Penicillium manginii]|uniref:uncharacterized protein n=1 Tax=Penicillium manginii TaxID=203109 RepID=UPI00254890ED|nr:uncharacterized protein N7533_001962 [Penicillium manginii]KAJ5763281.1 hypothetical protein N7533_001962 [Penicillium manginii]